MKTPSALVGALLLALGAVGAHAAIPAGAVVEHIEKTIKSPFGALTPTFQWDVSYERYFDGTSLVKHVEIDFLFLNVLGYSPAQKAAWKADAEAAVESMWNNKFAIQDTANGKTYALAVDVTLDGYPVTGLPNRFDQAVTVAPRPADCDARPNDLACRDNMLNWFDDGSSSVKAHEFGHMIGLYDEYAGGATDKANNPTLSDDGVMGLGALSAEPVFHARYYQQYLDFIGAIPLADYRRLAGADLASGQFVLVAVPEPSTWAMLVAGSMMLVIGVRRARRA